MMMLEKLFTRYEGFRMRSANIDPDAAIPDCKYNMKNEGGISLVELAIAMACIGLLMGGTLMISNAIKQARYNHDTNQKMNIIADQLSIYAQHHNRLPCPASPIRQNESDGVTNQAAVFGDERKFAGIANNINRTADCYDNQAASHGLVPFRALGLDEKYARDAWGRYFTYVVSPVSARYNYVNVADTTVNRNVAHYITTNAERALGPKYRFCHGMPDVPRTGGAGAAFVTATSANDIQYFPDLAAGFPYARGQHQETIMGATLADPIFANDYQATGVNESPHTLRVAFALISHGSNGMGVYFGNETNNKKPFLGLRPSEQANADIGGAGANTVFGIEHADGSAAAALLMDDIVLMRTQDQIYARKGGQSCVTP